MCVGRSSSSSSSSLQSRRKEEEEEEDNQRELRVKKRDRVRAAPPRRLVTDREAEKRGTLFLEHRARNAAETQEALVVQYMALGGYAHFVDSANATFPGENGDGETLARLRRRAVHAVGSGEARPMSTSLHADECDGGGVRTPRLAASCIHAGSGQQVFGWSNRQRCDLLLAFYSDDQENQRVQPPAHLLYHNFHGEHWHYRGHVPDIGCPGAGSGGASLQGGGGMFALDDFTRRADSYRAGLADALSRVAPHRVLFTYTASYSCHFFHGRAIPPLPSVTGDARRVASEHNYSLASRLSRQAHTHSGGGGGENNLKVVLQRDAGNRVWLPLVARTTIDQDELKEGIRSGRLSGFATVVGGHEHPSLKSEDPAGTRFGFCVQNYAPSARQLSNFTKQQIIDHNGMTGASEAELELAVSRFLSRQPARTLNSTTFHAGETVSTTYLRWLMLERRFDHFDITHMMFYEFRDWSRHFLEPVLQERHDYKRAGNTVAAECLKLLGNGSYGYNGLESSNYDDVRLITENALRKRLRGDLAHITLKHLTVVGVIRVPSSSSSSSSSSKRSRKRGRRRRRPSDNPIVDAEARESREQEEEEEDDPSLEATESESDSDDENENEI